MASFWDICNVLYNFYYFFIRMGIRKQKKQQFQHYFLGFVFTVLPCSINPTNVIFWVSTIMALLIFLFIFCIFFYVFLLLPVKKNDLFLCRHIPIYIKLKKFRPWQYMRVYFLSESISFVCMCVHF